MSSKDCCDMFNLWHKTHTHTYIVERNKSDLAHNKQQQQSATKATNISLDLGDCWQNMEQYNANFTQVPLFSSLYSFKSFSSPGQKWKKLGIVWLMLVLFSLSVSVTRKTNLRIRETELCVNKLVKELSGFFPVVLATLSNEDIREFRFYYN